MTQPRLPLTPTVAGSTVWGRKKLADLAGKNAAAALHGAAANRLKTDFVKMLVFH